MEQEPEAFLAEAERMGQFLLKKARTRADGSLFWSAEAAKAADPGSEKNGASFGPHLYAGHAGAALFLAALGKTIGEESLDEKPFGQAALRILIPLRRQLRKLAEQPGNREIQLGAITGLSSFIYTFLRIGSWLKRPDLIEDACEIATLITPERINKNRSADLMSGSAGVLLVLLLLEHEAPPAWRSRLQPLARAVACGEHLLHLRLRTGDDFGGWPNFVQPASSGLAHGASGVALALLRLARRSERQDFRAAAMDGLAFERLHFDEDIDNWWPVRFHKTRLQLNSWCNGAAGIALARLAMLPLEPSPAIRDDLDRALASASRAAAAPLDAVCCGNFGRADILLEASRLLGRAELSACARRLTWPALEAANARSGRYRTNAQGELCPGFFTGLSGIGYALLRLAGNSDLPCVLALE